MVFVLKSLVMGRRIQFSIDPELQPSLVDAHSGILHPASSKLTMAAGCLPWPARSNLVVFFLTERTDRQLIYKTTIVSIVAEVGIRGNYPIRIEICCPIEPLAIY